jgi:hypothetical protein
VIPFAMGQRVAAAIPHATFVPVKGAHHMNSVAGDAVFATVCDALLRD